MFGLQHCYYFECALNESSSISQAELQPLFLCPVCLRKLHKVLKFDVTERYHLLHQKLSDVLSILRLHKAAHMTGQPVREIPHEELLSENPQTPFVISSSPSRTPSGVDQPTKTNAVELLQQQEKFTDAIEWLKKCIDFIDTIT